MNQQNEQNEKPPIMDRRLTQETFPGESHLANLTGFLRTVDTAPTYTPKTFCQGIVMYANGSTYRLYIYDFKNKAWRYDSLKQTYEFWSI